MSSSAGSDSEVEEEEQMLNHNMVEQLVMTHQPINLVKNKVMAVVMMVEVLIMSLKLMAQQLQQHQL